MREGKLLEQITELRFSQLRQDLDEGNPDGVMAFLWLAMRKNNRHVPFESLLDTKMSDIHFVVDEPDPTKASPETPTDE